MVTLALEGPAPYRDKRELVLRRRAGEPNQISQADHTRLDILVRAPSGRPARPWLTVIETTILARSAGTTRSSARRRR